MFADSKMATFRPIVMAGPSGSGKSTLLKRLMAEFPDCFAFSVSHTTRKPRPGEENGREYHFVTREQMIQEVKDGKFIESAEFSGNMYGTSVKSVQNAVDTGKICILDIDMQGVKSVKKTNLSPIYVLVKPPSMEALEERLRGRGTETEESLKLRLETAKGELEYASTPGVFDHVLVNNDLDTAYTSYREIFLPFIKELQAGSGEPIGHSNGFH